MQSCGGLTEQGISGCVMTSLSREGRRHCGRQGGARRYKLKGVFYGEDIGVWLAVLRQGKDEGGQSGGRERLVTKGQMRAGLQG